MCWLKNLHFTLRRACIHLDHLATHIHSMHTGNWPLGCWRFCVCMCATKNMLFSPIHATTSRACTQFRGYLKNQRQTKTLPPPSPPPPIQRRRAEKERNKRNEERKGKALWRGRRVFEYRPRQGCQKGSHRREEVNEKRVDLTETFSLDLNWVYVFTQPANNSVQGAWPYSIHHTHTIKWKGMRCQFQMQLIWKSEWIWFAFPPNSMACVGWCYPNSSRKERLSLTLFSLIVHTATVQSVTGFSMNSARRLGLYIQALQNQGPCVTTCDCVYVG